MIDSKKMLSLDSSNCWRDHIHGLYPVKTMASLHVATVYLGSLILCTKNETVAPLPVATLTVKKEL